jgi:hypothetical protein
MSNNNNNNLNIRILKKYVLTLFILFIGVASFSQVTPVNTVRIANSATAIGENVPVGTLVIDIDSNKIYLAKASIASTQTLTTATASFELANDVVNDSYSLVSTTANYTTQLTKGGTLLVSPAAGATVTITLTTTNVAAGKRYSVKKANETDGTVNVVTESGSIEGTLLADGIQTNVPYQGWILKFDGVNWHIIGHI